MSIVNAYSFFVPGNTPSSKNSKRIVSKKLKSGKSLPFLIDSELTAKYKKNLGIVYASNKARFLLALGEFNIATPEPLYVGFYFIRDSYRDFDYHNALQVVADMMVEYGLIPDDNARQFLPVFLGYHVDKSNSGVHIRLLSGDYARLLKPFKDHYSIASLKTKAA